MPRTKNKATLKSLQRRLQDEPDESAKSFAEARIELSAKSLSKRVEEAKKIIEQNKKKSK